MQSLHNLTLTLLLNTGGGIPVEIVLLNQLFVKMFHIFHLTVVFICNNHLQYFKHKLTNIKMYKLVISKKKKTYTIVALYICMPFLV